MNPPKQSWAVLKRRYGYKAYIFVAIILYSAICSALILSIHNAFRTYTWDLGIFNQALWTTLNGRLFYYTCEPFYTTTGNFLGVHFGPILFLILPFYAICPRPETLLVMSPIITALGAIPAYEIARLFLKDDKVATLLGISYLLYLPLQGVTISGFSLELIALPLFLFILYFLVKGDFKKLPLIVMLGLMTHEASAPVIAFIGLYGMWYYRSLKSRGFQISLTMSVVSMVYFVFAQNMRIFLGWTQGSSLWHEWALIGAESPTSLPIAIIMNPVGAWRSLTVNGSMKIVFLLMYLIPTAFLPLFEIPALLPAFPYLFLSMFSSYAGYYNIENHYGAFLVPFFFVALLHGIAKLERRPRLHVSASRMAKVILILSTVSLIAILPGTYSKTIGSTSRGEHARILREALAMIPQNASILTQNDLFPHVSCRVDAYTVPSPDWAKEYYQVAVMELRNLTNVRIDYVLLDLNSEPYGASGGRLILEQFIYKKNCYRIIVYEDGVRLFKLRT